jgi:predicted Zn-dependent protease
MYDVEFPRRAVPGQPHRRLTRMSLRPTLRLMKPSILLLIAALLTGSLGACTQNPATGERSFTAFMSPEEEVQVGRDEHPKIVAQFGGEYADPRLRAYVQRLGKSLAARSEMPDLEWHFTVLNSDIVNAFALPGGYIYVTRGLLALASSEAELASVLGHEIGHVTARHSAQRYSRGAVAQGGTVLATVIGGVLLGDTGAQLAQAVVGGGAQLALASYSRDQEFQADQLGVRYLARASYDPMAMARFLEKLQEETVLQAELAGRPNAANEFNFTQSHPRTPDRVRDAIAQAGAAARPDNPRILRDEYLRTIDGLSWGGDPENGFVKDAVFIHPGLRFRFEVPAGFRILNNPDSVMALGPGGAQIRFDVDSKAPPGRLAAHLVGMNLQRVQELTVDGLPAATGVGRARAQNGATFDARMALIAGGGNVWRFMFVTPAGGLGRYDGDFQRTLASFDQLSAQEAAAIRPFRVRTVRVAETDTQESLARRMATRDAALRRFQVLNGLAEGDRLQPGQLVKIIAE